MRRARCTTTNRYMLVHTHTHSCTSETEQLPTPLKVFGLGLLLSAANAKNAPLTLAAGAAISSDGIPVPEQIGALAVFVVIASLGVLAPLAVFLFMGERAERILGSWRDWAAQHNAALMAVLFFVLGLKLLGDGIGILAS
jgi:Sap, sulfolipid-1-addressing protein